MRTAPGGHESGLRAELRSLFFYDAASARLPRRGLDGRALRTCAAERSEAIKSISRVSARLGKVLLSPPLLLGWNYDRHKQDRRRSQAGN